MTTSSDRATPSKQISLEGKEVALNAELHANLDRLRVELDHQGQMLTAERIARSQAEVALRARDDLVATMADELRTPIAAIKNSAESMGFAIQQAPMTAEQAGRFLHAIRKSSDRLASMLTELLEESGPRGEERPLQLERRPDATISHRGVVSARTGVRR
jgi:signal transduction histidine kinase